MARAAALAGLCDRKKKSIQQPLSHQHITSNIFTKLYRPYDRVKFPSFIENLMFDKKMSNGPRTSSSCFVSKIFEPQSLIQASQSYILLVINVDVDLCIPQTFSFINLRLLFLRI